MAEGGPVLDRVLQFLLAQGGRVRDGELTERFRGFLEEGDPAKRAERCAEWKAALKACAVVKQDKGARFLVLKKKFRHLLGGDAAAGTHGSGGGGGEEEGERGGSSLTVEAQPHVHDGEEGEQQQQQQQEEVKKMDEEEEEAGTSGDGAEPLEVEGRGKEVEEAMVEEKQEVEEVDKEEDVVEAQEMCEQEAPAESRGADPEAALSSSSEGGRVEDGGGEDARGPPIRGHEPVSASSETISEQSEQLQSMCSRAETEQEDMGSITASSVTSLFVHMQLEPLERKWMRGAAVGCADTLRQLLAQDPSLASHRDFTSTALHWAAKHGSVETATLVAEAGVDVNARSGYTALHIATIHSREEMVELLITTLRVRQDVRDYSGRLAWHYGKARHGEAVTPNPTTPMRADKRSSRKLAGAFPGLLPYRASLAGPAGVPGAQAAQLGGPGNRASWSGGQPSRGGGGRWGGGHGRRRWGSAEDLVEEEEDGDALVALAAAAAAVGTPGGPAPQSLKLGRKSSK